MPTPEEILDLGSQAESSPSPSPVDQVLAGVTPQAGSYSAAAQALGQPITEGDLGDPMENGEHVVGHMGLRDLLDQKLSNKIVSAAERADAPEMAGVAGLGHVEKVVNNHSDLMEKRAKAVFQDKGAEYKEEELSPEDHKDIVEQLSNLANNPSALINDLTDATQALHAVAPQTAQSTQQTATRAIQFLASKAARPNPDPLGGEYEPSSTERAAFNRYLSVVEDPSLALHQVKEGTLLPETTETLQTVYPKLYDRMKQSLIAKLDPEMPYQKKMMVGQFLGQPLDSSMAPDRILSLQSSFVAPAMPPAAPGVKPTKKSLSKLNIADRTSLSPKEDE